MARYLRPRTILPALLVLVLALYLLVALVMVYAATRPERKPFEASPGDFGLSYEEVAFPPRDGDLTLRGWLLPGDAGAPYLVFVHGIGDQRSGNRAVELAARLQREGGYSILLFDLRAQGTSDGSFVSAGEFERYDILGAYDYLLGRGARSGQVALIGRSYGAATAIMAAALEPGIAAVVADSPFADVQDRIARETARKTPIPESVVPIFLPPARLFADVLYGIDLGSLKPASEVRKLAYPVLIIHGEADERIPIDEGREVYEAAPSGSEFWTLPGVGHAGGFPEQPEEYVRRVLSYLDSRFGP